MRLSNFTPGAARQLHDRRSRRRRPAVECRARRTARSPSRCRATRACAAIVNSSITAAGSSTSLGNCGLGATDNVATCSLGSTSTIAAGHRRDRRTRRRHQPLQCVDLLDAVRTDDVRHGARPPRAHIRVAAPQPPAVTGISPSSGSAAGGTTRHDHRQQLHERHRGRVRAEHGDELHSRQRDPDHRDLAAGSGTVDVTVTTPAGTSATGAARPVHL